MRNAFFEELANQARQNPKIFLLVGDLGFSAVEAFTYEFPSRWLNVGVAEQNMVGLAAGLASEGYQPFVYSIANFSTFRCLEQIRNDVCYHRFPVVIVSVGGGTAYGNLGYSHHAVQDYAVMRCLHPIIIASPGDPYEAAAAVAWLSQNPQPAYLRLGKTGEPHFHAAKPILEGGKILPMPDQPNEVNHIFLSTGGTLGSAVQAAQDPRLERRWGVFTLPLWGEAMKERVMEELKNFRSVVSVEDHLPAGGFGSYLQESLSGGGNRKNLRSVALNSSACDRVGNSDFLKNSCGISVEDLVRTALSENESGFVCSL